MDLFDKISNLLNRQFDIRGLLGINKRITSLDENEEMVTGVG